MLIASLCLGGDWSSSQGTGQRPGSRLAWLQPAWALLLATCSWGDLPPSWSWMSVQVPIEPLICAELLGQSCSHSSFDDPRSRHVVSCRVRSCCYGRNPDSLSNRAPTRKRKDEADSCHARRPWHVQQEAGKPFWGKQKQSANVSSYILREIARPAGQVASCNVALPGWWTMPSCRRQGTGGRAAKTWWSCRDATSRGWR
jgi:hypothetical protein